MEKCMSTKGKATAIPAKSISSMKCLFHRSRYCLYQHTAVIRRTTLMMLLLAMFQRPAVHTPASAVEIKAANSGMLVANPVTCPRIFGDHLRAKDR